MKLAYYKGYTRKNGVVVRGSIRNIATCKKGYTYALGGSVFSKSPMDFFEALFTVQTYLEEGNCIENIELMPEDEKAEWNKNLMDVSIL